MRKSSTQHRHSRSSKNDVTERTQTDDEEAVVSHEEFRGGAREDRGSSAFSRRRQSPHGCPVARLWLAQEQFPASNRCLSREHPAADSPVVFQHWARRK